MARVRVDFSLMGQDIDSELLSHEMGLEQAFVWRKGTPIQGSHLNAEDGWRISTGYVETGDALPVITSLLDLLDSVKDKVLKACEAFNLESQLSVVLELESDAPGFHLPVNILRKILAFNCSIDIDLISL